MKYIIDGYNVIHSIEQLRHKRLRSQREELIRLLEAASFRNRRFKDLTVVFDGQKGIVAPRIISNIKVVFSKGKCADRKIKEMVESCGFARDIGVVSDDRQIRSYASSSGAKRISVQEFMNKVRTSFNARATFKLDPGEAERINQELEQIWLADK
ncbi:MAG: NYN domain-containing protein [Candidatus Omnitrophica bacterium]|nr:NYN domain-containing protein [Candidatus Omnitrophota bacterium]